MVKCLALFSINNLPLESQKLIELFNVNFYITQNCSGAKEVLNLTLLTDLRYIFLAGI